MSDQIKRYFEVAIRETSCNLHCHYCYLAQCGVLTNKKASFSYSREQMRVSIEKERLGGACFFNLCADGETLLEQGTVDFAYDVLAEGHYVNVVTNGVISNRIREISDWPTEFHMRMMMLFSYHHLELQRLNLTKTFFDNVRRIRDAGISFFISMVQCEEYIDHYSEIKALFLSELGILPQIVKYRDDQKGDYSIKTDRTPQDYFELAVKVFDSNVARFEWDTYQKKVESFCYAGDWFAYLDLNSGDLRACYGFPVFANLFVDPQNVIQFQPIGNHCRLPYCYNGLSRMSMGVIPDFGVFDAYHKYRERILPNGRSTFSDQFKAATSVPLYLTNKPFSDTEKDYFNEQYVRNWERRHAVEVLLVGERADDFDDLEQELLGEAFFHYDIEVQRGADVRKSIRLIYVYFKHIDKKKAHRLYPNAEIIEDWSTSRDTLASAIRERLNKNPSINAFLRTEKEYFNFISLESMNVNRIILYGAGKYGRWTAERLKKQGHVVSFFLDNEVVKQRTLICGLNVYSPYVYFSERNECDNDLILITIGDPNTVNEVLSLFRQRANVQALPVEFLPYL